MRYPGSNVGFMTLHANTVVERFLIPLVPAKDIGLITQMTCAARISLSRGDRFCHPAISPSRADAAPAFSPAARHHRCLKGTEK
jgi:hypothetical protein